MWDWLDELYQDSWLDQGITAVGDAVGGAFQDITGAVPSVASGSDYFWKSLPTDFSSGNYSIMPSGDAPTLMLGQNLQDPLSSANNWNYYGPEPGMLSYGTEALPVGGGLGYLSGGSDAESGGGIFSKTTDWLNKNEKAVRLALTAAGLAQGLFSGPRKLSPLEQQQQQLNMAKMQAQMRQLEANRALPQYSAQRTRYNPLVSNRYGRSQQPAEARFMDTSVIEKARGGIIDGTTGGQDDVVPILGSHGEYILDASTVSDLGDGNTAAGADKLDQMVRNVRKHKRGRKSLPPRAKAPLEYMK